MPCGKNLEVVMNNKFLIMIAIVTLFNLSFIIYQENTITKLSNDSKRMNTSLTELASQNSQPNENEIQNFEFELEKATQENTKKEIETLKREFNRLMLIEKEKYSLLELTISSDPNKNQLEPVDLLSYYLPFRIYLPKNTEIIAFEDGVRILPGNMKNVKISIDYGANTKAARIEKIRFHDVNSLLDIIDYQEENTIALNDRVNIILDPQLLKYKEYLVTRQSLSSDSNNTIPISTEYFYFDLDDTSYVVGVTHPSQISENNKLLLETILKSIKKAID